MDKQFYYEFDEHEYYALIAVNVNSDDLKTKPHKQAAKIYFEQVGGESADDILEEATPNERTKDQAAAKFFWASQYEKKTPEDLVNEFESIQNGVLLIDAALL